MSEFVTVGNHELRGLGESFEIFRPLGFAAVGRSSPERLSLTPA